MRCRPASRRMVAVLSFGLCLTALPRPAAGQLTSVEASDFRLVYPGTAFDYVVPHIAACSENSLRFHRELYGYTPREPVTIFLEDFSDFGHGGANTVPVNFVNFGIAPFNYVYDTIPAVDRMFWMANHEMAHVATMDQAAGSDLGWRKFFAGKVDPTAENPLSIGYNYLTNPRWNAPRWYHEGIAVFLETWMSGGLGRVFGGHDEMVFRTMTRDGALFYDVVGLESEGTTTDFQVGVNSYLYGTRFMSWLAYRHGPEKLIEWTGRSPGSRAHFSKQFRQVYGVKLADAWSEWIEWEKEWQRANLERLRQNPTTPTDDISTTTLGSVSRAFLDHETGELLVAIRYPGQLAHLAAIDLDSGEVRKLKDLRGAAIYYVTSLAWDPDGRTLFYTTDNYGWRDLWSLDLDSGETRRLMKDGRVGDLAFNRADRSLWGVRHYNGISTLVRIAEPWEAWDQIYSWPYGQDLYEIDVSPDGTLVTGALAEVDGRQRLIRMRTDDLLAPARRGGLVVDEIAFDTLFDFENSSPANFTFSPNGRYLHGSSYYSGVSNVYRYDLDEEDMDILSNAETGFFRPVPLSEDWLLVFRYTGDGLVPTRIPNVVLDRVSAIRFLGSEIVEGYPVVKEWRAARPSAVDVEALTSEPETYGAFRKIRLNYLYPIVEGYKDSLAGGLRFNLSDPLNLSGFDLFLSYSPDDELDDGEKLHFLGTFHYKSWEVVGRYNPADFYDIFGPTKRSRRGYSLGLRYRRALFYEEERALRIDARIDGWGDLETLPYYQNIESDADQLLSGLVELDYESLRKSLGAVEEEQGVRWQLFGAANYADSRFSPLLFTNLDLGFPLPIRHSSLWLRTSAGQGFGVADDPFSNFFFGGFGNNWVDHLAEQRYREFHSFPGVELNEIGGRNYVKAMLEWTLPPVRFRHAGAPSFYFNWMRFALFTSGIRTNLDDSAIATDAANLGAQLDFRLVLFSNLPATLSFGYALAKPSGRERSEEVMVSLKIL